MRCFYDGSEQFLTYKDGKYRVKIITEGVLNAKFAYTTQIHAPFSVAKKLSIEMQKNAQGFTCEVVLGKEPIRYWFELLDEKGIYYYSSEGVLQKHAKKFDADFLIVPDFDTPNWTKGAVWYQIMPDSFFNGDTLCNKSDSNGTSVNVWGEARRGQNDYYGGDLYGIAQKVEYIKELSVDAVSINPIWMSTHNAGYGSFDLEQIDATFGGVNALQYLINVLHQNDMKLVLDGVFQYYHKFGKMYNAAGMFPMDGVAQNDETYADVFVNDCLGEAIVGVWGYPFDFSSALAREVIAGKDSPIQRYLAMGVDGWRLDVGNTYEGSDQDCYGACDTALGYIYDAAKSIGKDKLVLTEHPWGEMFSSGKCESKWNYDFGYVIRDWASKRIDNKEAERGLKKAIFSLPFPVAQSSFNFLTTHDLSRILWYANGDISALKSAIAVQFAFLGAPSIYSGDEIGMLGKPAEFVRDKAPTSFGCFNWNEEKQNKEIFGIYKTLAHLRKTKKDLFANGCCFSGAFGENMIAVVRSKNDDSVIAIGNVGESEKICIQAPLMSDGVYTDVINGNTVVVKNGKFEADIPHGCAFFAKDARCQILNGFKACGEVSYRGGVYKLGEQARLYGEIYGCYDIELNGTATVRCGCINVYDGQVEVFGERYQKTGKIRIQRNEEDVVTLKDEEGEIVCVKVDDPYTVALVVEGEGELAFTFHDNETVKWIADAAHGFSGMFDVADEKRQTRFVEGDFSVNACFCEDGKMEVFTQGAAVGVEIKENNATFYRVADGIFEVLGQSARSQEIILQRVNDEVSAYSVINSECVRLGSVKANYSSSKIGVQGEIERFVFGDGNGQISPQNAKGICFNGKEASLAKNLFGLKKICGEWQYCAEGIKLASESGALITNKEYGSFEIFFALKGEMMLEIGSVRLPFTSDGKTNYAVKRKEDEIKVYSGLPLRYQYKIKAEAGKQAIRFVMQTQETSLFNFWVQDERTDWVINRGKGYFNKCGELRFMSNSGDFWIASSAVFSDLSLSANVRFNKAESKEDGDFSILLGHSPFADNKTGLAVKIFHSGKIEVLQEGKTVAYTEMEELDVNSFFLWIDKKGENLQISIAPSYYDRDLRVVMQCNLPYQTGGKLSFYGRNISGAISDFNATVDANGLEQIVKIAKPTYIWLS